MRQLSGSGSGPGLGHSHGHGLVEESNWNWWPFGGESSVQSSRRSRDEAVDALLLRNNVSTGLGTVADPRISAMVGMVREVLPHVPDELIAQVCPMYVSIFPKSMLSCLVLSSIFIYLF